MDRQQPTRRMPTKKGEGEQVVPQRIVWEERREFPRDRLRYLTHQIDQVQWQMDNLRQHIHAIDDYLAVVEEEAQKEIETIGNIDPVTQMDIQTQHQTRMRLNAEMQLRQRERQQLKGEWETIRRQIQQ